MAQVTLVGPVLEIIYIALLFQENGYCCACDSLNASSLDWLLPPKSCQPSSGVWLIALNKPILSVDEFRERQSLLFSHQRWLLMS